MHMVIQEVEEFQKDNLFLKDNKLCLWLIEHKLTEQEFTTCGGYRSKGISDLQKACCTSCGIEEILEDHNKCYYHERCGYYYWEVMDKHSTFFTGKYEGNGCPFRGGMNQLWRNQLLALELENRGVPCCVHDLACNNAGELGVSGALRDVFRYDTIVVGSPTYNNGIYPPVETFMKALQARLIK